MTALLWLDSPELALSPARKHAIRLGYATLPRDRCASVDPSAHPSTRDRRCESPSGHEGTHRRQSVCPGWGSGSAAWS